MGQANTLDFPLPRFSIMKTEHIGQSNFVFVFNLFLSYRVSLHEKLYGKGPQSGIPLTRVAYEAAAITAFPSSEHAQAVKSREELKAR